MKAQRGFTLIELLIAMTIAAIISVLAYQAIDSSVRVNERVEAHQQQWRQLQTAWWWLEQDLIQIAPRAVNDGLQGRLPAMEYRLDLGLALTRFHDAQGPFTQAGSYGLSRVGYQLRDGNLLRLHWPVVDRAPGTEVTERLLLSGVENFSVRFLDEKQQWSDVWPPVNQASSSLRHLPRAVEVSVRQEAGQEVRRLFAGVDWIDFSAPIDNGESAAGTQGTQANPVPNLASNSSPLPAVNTLDLGGTGNE
ncbi:MAG: type II secretion system minor pseudopilin GspJ [Thiotrichales bacterium]|nr:type II secretion system minor pseudopilin GspJ [Thiotrichales bacterium]